MRTPSEIFLYYVKVILVDNEMKYILIAFAKLYDYQTYDLENESMEFINYFNKMTLRPIDKDTFSISYNLEDGQHEVLCKTESIYHTFEVLLNRKNYEIISVRNEKEICLAEHFHELKTILFSLIESKTYNHYLKHEKLQSERFEIEYYDNMVLFRDKQDKLLTNAFSYKKVYNMCHDRGFVG